MDNIKELLQGNQNNPTAVLMEILKTNDIEMKISLSSRQLRALFKVFWLEKINDPSSKFKRRTTLILETILMFFQYLPSKNGERVKQVTDTLKEMKPQLEETPLIKNL